MVGHYGTPAIVAGGLSIALLIMHLVVPFAVDDFPSAINDAGQSDEPVSLKDMGDRLDVAIDAYGLSSLGLVMTGLVLALVGGVLLFVLGFVPIPVNVARFLGWTLATVGAMGSFFAATASLFHVGAGFTTLLGVLGGYDGAHLWIVSPVITAAGSITLLAFFLKIMAGVVRRADDLRTDATNVLRVPFLATLLLAAVLVMPLSIQAIDGDDRSATGEPCAADGCSGYLQFWAAGGATTTGNSVGILSTAETTQDTGADLFQGLAMTVKVVIAAAWVAFFVGILSSLGHVITSVTNTPLVAKVFGAFQLGNLITVPWAAVMLVIAMAVQTWKPAEDVVLDAMPEFAWYSLFLPIVALATVVLLSLRLAWNLLDIFGSPQEVVASTRDRAVSFD